MRDGKSEPIVGPPRERPLLHGPHTDIACHRLGAVMGNPRSNATREAGSDGERRVDRHISPSIMRHAAVYRGYGGAISPEAGLDPAFLAQLVVRLGYRQQAVLMAQSLGDKLARPVRIACHPTEE